MKYFYIFFIFLFHRSEKGVWICNGRGVRIQGNVCQILFKKKKDSKILLKK